MKRTLLSLSTTLALCVGFASAADWPQWRGPNRDARSTETGLLKTFPKEGPKLLWSCKTAGLGYSGPAIVGNVLYSCGASADKEGEFVFALDTATGKPLWKTDLALQRPDKNFNANWGGGPRCTPTVDGNRLYVLGAQGDLACLDTASGKIVWQKNLPKDLNGRVMKIWGYSESPLVDGERLICCPGGEEGTVAALDKATGKVLWRSQGLTDDASYGSVVISQGGGVKQYVLLTAEGAAGVAADSGKLLWKNALGKNGIAVIPTPIVEGDIVYVTSDYGSGCGAVKLVAEGAGGVKANVLFDNKEMQNHHGGVILVEGHIFGSNGNAAGKSTLPWICQSLKDGSVVWKDEKTLEPSSVVFADGHFYCYGQKTGKLVCLEPSTKALAVKGSFAIPEVSKKRKPQGGIWTHPVIAHGKLYLRDQELLYCFDLREARAGQ